MTKNLEGKMTYRLLFVDHKRQVDGAITILKGRLGVQVDVAESLDDAASLLQAQDYSCVIVEPFDKRYLRRERESPFLKFIRDLRVRNTAVLIGSTYTEAEFQESFGLTRANDYEGYQRKPWLMRQFTEEVARIMRSNK